MKNKLLYFFLLMLSSMQVQGQENEHLYHWEPEKENLYLRQGYVMSYLPEYRIPNWVAYHVTPDYLNTPKRKGKFSSFRVDKEIENAVSDKEYKGLFASLGYARGHLAPFAVMGGDRDKDEKYADYDKTKSDVDDEKTVYEANYMSNIAPQHHQAINGAGGLWFKLERWIQDKLVEENQKELWVIAGNIIIDTRSLEKVGADTSIVVPDMFYKIVIMEETTREEEDTEEFRVQTLAFLFPHYKLKADIQEGEIFKYVVPIDYIEALTGIDFLNQLSDLEQKDLEMSVDLEVWEKYLK